MAIVYVEVICNNPECRSDLAYGDAYKDDGTTIPCPYCGCEDSTRYFSYDD